MIDKERQQTLNEKAERLKALAHPSRLLILEELIKKECYVNELVELVGAEVPTVSNHLKVLRNAGFIDKEKRGTQVYYRLVEECVLTLFSCMDHASQK